MTARAKAGCQACRTRHLKCDQKIPTCGRCQASGRECTRGYPYRYQQSKFSRQQKWVKTPQDVSFVDETEQIANGYGDEDEELEDYEEMPQSMTKSQATVTPTDQRIVFGTPFAEDNTLITPQTDLASPADFPVVSPPEYGSRSSIILPPLHSLTPFVPYNSSSAPTSDPFNRLNNTPSLFNLTDASGIPAIAASSDRSQEEKEDRGLSIYDIASLQTSFDNGLPTPTIYLEKAVWPLKDPREALLLRHFVRKLAIWLDLCDPMQHFQVEVPKRAGTCPILLNAIFALAARHLSRTGNYDSFASNRYHQECLKYLIPMLNNHATIADETLFAATIILRVLEEIDMPENDNAQSHMLGIQVFVNTRDPSTLHRGGLAEAAFWVGLRQEIYSAMMSSKPISLNLSSTNPLVDRSLLPTSDFIWANRAVVHCADVLNFCFGNERHLSVHEWQDVGSRVRSWRDESPSSFEPIFYKERSVLEKEAFPEVWYSMACHVIGVQHHKLAEILLAIFDPRIPKVGASRSIAVKTMEEEIVHNLRSLCGIGLSNPWSPPGMFTASMGIAICGDRFTSRSDQEALLDVLVRTERDHARPTATVQDQMKRSWGWIDT